MTIETNMLVMVMVMMIKAPLLPHHLQMVKDENNTVFVMITHVDPDMYSPSIPDTWQQELIYLGIRVLTLVYS